MTGRALLEIACAQAAHEANRAFCFATGDGHPPAWEHASPGMQASTLAAVEGVLDGRIATPEDAHASWMRARLACGWTYGPDKCETRLTHPSLRPWRELSARERMKDVLFLAVVRAMACALLLETDSRTLLAQQRDVCSSTKLRVVVKRPGAAAEVAELDDTVEAFQAAVGGYFNALQVPIPDGGAGADFDLFFVEDAAGLAPNVVIQVPLASPPWIPFVFLGPVVASRSDAKGDQVSLTEAEARRIARALDECSA
jgi:hypothetical protein